MKYSVMVGRTVSQTAFVEVEADSKERAKVLALDAVPTNSADWESDDAFDYGVLHVHPLTDDAAAAKVETC